jgi:hypothetical protein
MKQCNLLRRDIVWGFSKNNGVSSNSDLFKRIFQSETKHSDLDEYLGSGVSQFIADKKDPYYTIVKNKIHENYLSSDVKVDKVYKEQMVSKLRDLFWSFSEKDSFHRNFIEICIEYVKNNNTAISKSALMYLNQLNKDNRQ